MAVSCSRHLNHILSANGVAHVALMTDALLKEFGSLPAVLSGSRARKRRAGADAIAIEAIDAFRAAMLHSLRADLVSRNIIDSASALESYLRAKIGNEPVEELHVFHLNTRNRLIADQMVTRGTYDSTPFYVREIIQRGIELGSASLIIAHNHPSGDATPSEGDITATRSLVQAAKIFSIRIHDHIIVSAGENYSFAMNGII
jgi:DNA repair protein RadC